MPSTFSPNLRVELIAAGEQAGTWGSTTNTNVGTLLEGAISGYASVSVTSANQALTALNGAADESRMASIRLTTTTTADFSVYVPPAPKQYTVYNASSYTATIYNSTVLGNTTAAGTGVAIPAGATVSVWTEGTNVRVQNDTLLGTATNAANINIAATTSSDTTTSVVLVGSQSTGNQAPFIDSGLTYNANTDTLSASNFSGAFSGTSTTQAYGTNNTSLATTAFVQAALQALYPVGSIYINASVTTNPGTMFGFGTWVEFGAGRVMVGQNTSDALFDTLEETGGSKDAIVVAHNHTAATDTAGAHQHSLGWRPFLDGSGATGGAGQTGEGGNIGLTGSAGAHSHTVTVNSTGSSGTNANLQPYIVVKMWKRTA